MSKFDKKVQKKVSQMVNCNLSCAMLKVVLQCYSQSHQPHSSQLFHDLTGTIPSFHCSNPEAVNGERPLGVIPAGDFFWNGW